MHKHTCSCPQRKSKTAPSVGCFMTCLWYSDDRLPRPGQTINDETHMTSDYNQFYHMFYINIIPRGNFTNAPNNIN